MRSLIDEVMRSSESVVHKAGRLIKPLNDPALCH